ncbi:hypothetical protein [Lujinxingia litoralis]|nr:hypothetical protein [Lujinxingia litoralis]
MDEKRGVFGNAELFETRYADCSPIAEREGGAHREDFWASEVI